MNLKLAFFSIVVLTIYAGNVSAQKSNDCRTGKDDNAKFAACTIVINSNPSNHDYLDIAYTTRGLISCRRGNSAAATADFEQKPRATQWAMKRAGHYTNTTAIVDRFTPEAQTALAAWVAKRCPQQ